MFCANCEYTIKQASILNKLRKLWEQHVHWTRSFIISTVESLGDVDEVTKRLLQNPTDFADFLEALYGKMEMTTFEYLFTQHLLIAADLVLAAKNKDMVKANEAREKWYQNADDIASFLAEINPHWEFEKWKKLFYHHLQMTEEEATLRLERKYAEDVAIYDQIEEEALEMADYMFEGTIRQFYIC